jgi:LacI family transcriptional regulator, galactose operon repressor
VSKAGNNERPAATRERLPTVLDVARLAGVSKTTVSDVIREQGSVAATTRARVFEAIETLGYRPNIAARSLKLQRTEVLGVVAGDFFDPFNAEVTAHIEREAAGKGYRVLLATTGDSRIAEASGVQSLLEYRVAALIFVGFSGDARVAELLGTGPPTIFISYESPLGSSVTIDEKKGGDIATTHLVELGHRRIAYLSTTFAGQKQLDRSRISGYRRALRRAGITPSDDLVLRLGGIPGAEREAIVHGLLSRKDRPTAIFASSDITALELMGYVDRIGLDIPDDLSVVGFDNIAVAGLPRISLTTVAQASAQMAKLAVEAAIARLQDPGLPLGTQLIQPELIVRRSTAPPR